MVHTHPASFCLLIFCTVPFGGKFIFHRFYTQMESARNLTNLGTNGKEISWDRKFPENSKTVKLPKCEPFKPKFREFWEENKMERKSSVGKFGCFPEDWKRCEWYRNVFELRVSGKSETVEFPI